MAGDQDDSETPRRQVALFRHAIIGALDIEALPRGERSARLAELAARTSQTPDGRARRFSIRTLWAWWSAYQRVGLAELLPKVRKAEGRGSGPAGGGHRPPPRRAVALDRDPDPHPADRRADRPRPAPPLDAGPPPRRGGDGPAATPDPRRQALPPAALGSGPPAVPDPPSRRGHRPLLEARPARRVVPERTARHPRGHPEAGHPHPRPARGRLLRPWRGLPRRPVRLRVRPPRHHASPQHALHQRRPRRHRALESDRRRAGRARAPRPPTHRAAGDPAPVRGLARAALSPHGPRGHRPDPARSLRPARLHPALSRSRRRRRDLPDP